MLNLDTLVKGVNQLDIELKEEELDKFLKYKELLIEWNEMINITAITENREVDIKHFLDSLTPLTTKLFEGNKKVIDIGTGGGFPGLPLKITNDNLEVLLLDSLNKRIKFLNEVISQLQLSNIKALHGRAEELSRRSEYREEYDIAISRAVASLDTLSEYCLPFVKPGGYFIAMKGPDMEEELEKSLNSINILGARLKDKIYITIPESDIVHSLIIIEKIRQTPRKYPRGGGQPRKNPL